MRVTTTAVAPPAPLAPLAVTASPKSPPAPSSSPPHAPLGPLALPASPFPFVDARECIDAAALLPAEPTVPAAALVIDSVALDSGCVVVVSDRNLVKPSWPCTKLASVGTFE